MWSIMTNYVPNVNGDIPPSLMVLFDLTGVPHVNAITMLGMPQVIQGIPVDMH